VPQVPGRKRIFWQELLGTLTHGKAN